MKVFFSNCLPKKTLQNNLSWENQTAVESNFLFYGLQSERLKHLDVSSFSKAQKC